MDKKKQATQTAVFGGGCFWCTEAVFKSLRGVTGVTPGYAGGFLPDPVYEQVCAGVTGHAEVVKVDFDPAGIGYRDLLEVFFATHDPTTVNRQGQDVGEQYRSVILYADEGQKREAEKVVGRLTKEGVYGRPIMTEVKPLEEFYQAEEYHRDYFARHTDRPYCRLVINPKLDKLKAKFRSLLKAD